MTPAWRQLALLSLAELFALSLWFSASAQRVRRVAGAHARVGARPRRQRRPHDRRPGRLHRRHARERARQPSRRLLLAPGHDGGHHAGRGGQRRVRPLGLEPRTGAAAPLRDGRVPGRRLPARDEDHGDVVPRGPRARDRDSRRRPHRRLGDAASHPGPDGASLARHLARRVRTRPRGRYGRSALRRRRSSPLPVGPLRRAHGGRGLPRARATPGLLRLSRPHVGALCDVGMDRRLPGGESRDPWRRQSTPGSIRAALHSS